MLCRHFGICGGCATQDLPYVEEVARKEAALAEALGRPVAVVPSPRELHYRTRMDYVFAWNKLGLRKRGDPRGVLDLEELPRGEPAHPGDDRVREDLDLRVVCLHVGVVDPAGGLNLVLQLRRIRDPRVQ